MSASGACSMMKWWNGEKVQALTSLRFFLMVTENPFGE